MIPNIDDTTNSKINAFSYISKVGIANAAAVLILYCRETLDVHYVGKNSGADVISAFGLA